MHLFSGRPDPVWTLTQAQARQLVEIWNALQPAHAVDLPVAHLGYRGCFVADHAGHAWLARAGIVSLSAGSGAMTRADPDRLFEHAVLATAPLDFLPAGLADERG